MSLACVDYGMKGKWIGPRRGIPGIQGRGAVMVANDDARAHGVETNKCAFYSYEDGNLVENLNDTTSLTYEVSKATATSKYDIQHS